MVYKLKYESFSPLLRLKVYPLGAFIEKITTKAKYLLLLNLHILQLPDTAIFGVIQQAHKNRRWQALRSFYMLRC